MYSINNIILIILLICDVTWSQNCKVPEADILFVLDGTIDVGTVNFGKIKDFVHQYINKLDIGLQKTRVGLVQFTPTARPEFYPLNYLSASLVQKAINEVPYKPCIGNRNVCYGAAKDVSSLNYVAQFGMSPASGNRPRIPDALVVITGEGYRPTPYRVNETLFQPLSELFVFVIKIGTTGQKLDLSIPFATKSYEMQVNNYDLLPDNIEPLCQQMTSFIQGKTATTSSSLVTGQTPSSGDTTVVQATSSLGWVPFLLLFIIAAVLIIVICWLVCRSKNETKELKEQRAVLSDYDQWAVASNGTAGKAQSVQVTAAQDGRLYTGPYQVHNKGAGTKRSPRPRNSYDDGTTITDFDLDDDSVVQVHRRHDEGSNLRRRRRDNSKDGSDRSKNHRHKHRHKHNRSKTVDSGDKHSNDARRDSKTSLNRSNSQPNNPSEKTSYLNGGYEGSDDDLDDKLSNKTPRPTNERKGSQSTVNMGANHKNRKRAGEKTSDYSSEHSREIEMEETFTKSQKKSMVDDGNNGEQDETSLLGAYSRLTKFGSRLDQQDDVHPSKRLPPVDLLLMVDNSGSIGMVNFNKLKDFLVKLIDNVNLGPGKSRIACVTFSTEPDLYFSFDRFFTPDAVKAALKRIPYKGGQTFLGRALQFASGILAQEKSVYAAGASPKKKKNKDKKTKKDSKEGNLLQEGSSEQQVALSPRPQASVLGKRLQVVIVFTDGTSEDAVDNASKVLHQKIGARVGAVGFRTFRKDKLKEITGYEGSAFLLHEQEAVCNWLLKQQSIWLEVHGPDDLAIYNEITIATTPRTARSMPNPDLQDENAFIELTGRVSRILTSPLDDEHLADFTLRKGMPPMDLLLMLDNSGSIGMVNFKKCKDFLCRILDDVDVGLGKSRVGCIAFAKEPEYYFPFDKFYVKESIRAQIQRMPFTGGSTFVGKALERAADILEGERSSESMATQIYTVKAQKTPRQGQAGTSVLGLRLQVVIIVTDGSSEDSIDQGAKTLHQRLGARIAAVGPRENKKDSLSAITGAEENTFLLHERQAVCNWLLRQQAIWLHVHSFNPAVYGGSQTHR